MSTECPENVLTDNERTAFGQCLDIARTPRGGGRAGAPPVPSLPYPSLTDQGTAGVGLSLPDSSLSLEAFTSELFQLLDSGVASLSDTRNGRPWPRPRKEGIHRLVERYDEETCRRAAREAREIVQSQDLAPNVTNLFAKKCADIEAEREAERLARREEIRRALA